MSGNRRKTIWTGLEKLEDRTTPAVFTVDSLLDDAISTGADGTLTLREALEAANTDAAVGDAPAGDADGDVIQFDPSLVGGTVLLEQGSLVIEDDVFITGLAEADLSDQSITVSGNDSVTVFGIDSDLDGPVDFEGLTITAGSGNSGGIFDGTAGGAIFDAGGNDVGLTDVTIAANSGSSGGGVFLLDSTLTVTGSVFTGNTANDGDPGNGGGAIFAADIDSVVDVSDSTFTMNEATGDSDGGAIFNNEGELLVTTSLFMGNTAGRAGGAIENNAGLVDLIEVTALGNDAGVNGGGFHTSGGGDVIVDGGVFQNNTAGEEGGGLWNSAIGLLTIQNGTLIDSNTASGDDPDQGGGGVFNVAGAVMIDGSAAPVIISNNVADGTSGSGGGVMSTGGLFDINDAEITGNTANRAGGGAEIDATSSVITNVLFDDNDIGAANPGNGGGIHAAGFADVDVTGSTFTNNDAVEGGAVWAGGVSVVEVISSVVGTAGNPNTSSADGGGLYNDDADLTVTLSTVAYNEAGGDGGGFGQSVAPTISTFVTNTTVSNNFAAGAGGGVQADGGIFDLFSSTVEANDAGGTGDGIQADGSVTFTVTNSVVSHSTGGGADDVDGLISEGDSFIQEDDGDPLLGALADNGGPTLTHVPMAGSPLIDAGDSAQATDQRGVTRPQNGTDDIGAIEVTEADGAADIIYVNDDFTDPDGTEITDADPNTAGDQTAFIGVNAFATIQEGVDAAADGGTVFITDDLDTDGAATYDENVVIDKNVSLVGTEADPTAVTVDGGDNGSVFDIGDFTTSLSGMTIQNGTAVDGGGVFNEGTLTIDNSVIRINEAVGDGNGVPGSGGGVFSSGTLTVTDTTIDTNTANRAGGGIEIADGSGLTTLTNVDLTNNSVGDTPGNGGGLHVTGSPDTVITGGTVTGNTAGAEGGGLWNGSGTMTVTGGTLIDGNTASGDDADQGGGGVFNNGGTVNIDGATISNNVADGAAGSGGGILSDGGTLTVTDTAIDTNTATRAGGGIEVTAANSPATATVTDVTISGNDAGTAPGNGGGLHTTAAAGVTITGGTISGNTAVQGGGVWNSATGSVSIDGTTISGNAAAVGGGVYNLATDGDAATDLTVSVTNIAPDGGPEDSGVFLTPVFVAFQDGTVDLYNQGEAASPGLEALAEDGVNDTVIAEFLAAQADAIAATLGMAPIGPGETVSMDFAGLDPSANRFFTYGSMVVPSNDFFVGNGNPQAFELFDDDGNFNGPITFFSLGSEVLNAGTEVDNEIDAAFFDQMAPNTGDDENGVVELADGFIGSVGNPGGTPIILGGTQLVATMRTFGTENADFSLPGYQLLAFTISATPGMTISNATISGNTATGDDADNGGGGVFNAGDISITDTDITGNSATGTSGSGGGVLTADGSVTVTGGSISGNTANRAGGGVEAIDGDVTLNGVTLGGATEADGNDAGAAPGNGGGLHTTGDAAVVINGGTVQNNTAGNEGGGLWNSKAGSLVVQGGTVISDNTADGAGKNNGGGGVFNLGGAVTLNGVTVSGNDASSGGGVFNLGGPLTVTNVTLTGNTTDGPDMGQGGGGILNVAGDVTVTGSTLSANTADGASGSGGGILSRGGTLTVADTVISSNVANRAGGGIEIGKGTVALTDTDLDANDTGSSPGNGGGLHITFDAAVSITGGGVTNNIAGNEGGGLWNSSTGSLTVEGTTISGNTALIGGGVFTQAAPAGTQPVSVSVSNVAPDNGPDDSGLFVTPVFVAFQDGTVDLYNQGEAASPGLEALAEDGVNDTVIAEFLAAQADAIAATLGMAPIGPGESVSQVFSLDPSANRFFTYGSMVVPSNDFFVGNGNPQAFELFDDDGDFNGPITFMVLGSEVLNAGTEVDNEIDAAFFDQMAPNTGDDENGVVELADGFIGSVGNPGGTPIILGGTQLVAMMRTFGTENADFSIDGYELLAVTIEQSQATGTFLNDVTVDSNTATGEETTQGGGGVFNGGNTVVSGGTVSNNSAAPDGAGNGGGFFNATGATLTIDGVTVTGNTAGRAGGGVENNAGTVTIAGSSLRENTAGVNGGGVHVSGEGTTDVTGGDFTDNVAVNEGGGLWNSAAGSMTLTEVTVDSNDAAFGGGVFNDGDGGDVTIARSLLSANTASTEGGGASSEGGSLTLINTTVSGNTAAGDGGGVLITGGTGSVSNSTVALNEAAAGGGVLVTEDGVFNLVSSAVALNTTPTPEDGPDVAGTIASGGFNLIGDGNDDGTLDIEGDVATVLIGVDPMLGALADNGGPTLTHLPLEGSPLIDAGDNPLDLANDQRGDGFDRVVGDAADIGAVEFGAGSPPPPPPSGVPATNLAAGVAGGGSTVTVFDNDGDELYTVDAFEAGFTGGTRTALADIDGDDIPDLIAGSGPGRPNEVRVFAGVDQSEVLNITPFEASFTGGVYVAGGDFNGDGVTDIVVSAGELGGARVAVFDGATGETLADFFGIDDLAFRGGARVGVGDFNGDGSPDIFVAAGESGGPRVAIYDGSNLQVGVTPPKLVDDFFAFEQSLRNGVNIAAGDLNGDGSDDVFLGAGPDGGPRVRVFDATELAGGFDPFDPGADDDIEIANFFGGDVNNRSGIRIAAKDLDGDDLADIVVGSGDGSLVTAYFGTDVEDQGTPDEAFTLNVGNSGVFVG